MAISDTLYSLEIFVSEIDELLIPCQRPAIAFRFLDFPTVIIYSKKDENGYKFFTGKSCLFKMNEDAIITKIQKTPVYVMLLDCFSEKPVLLGTCGISLVNILLQISISKIEFDSDIPSFGEIKCVFNFQDFMSTDVGKITMSVKLTSFGKSLLQHTSAGNNKLQKIDFILNHKNNLELDSSNSKKEVSKTEHNNVIDKLSDNSYLDSDKAKFIKTDKASQTLIPRKNVSNAKKSMVQFSDVKETSKVDNEKDFSNNIYCPPPLYLNLHDDKHLVRKALPIRQDSQSEYLLLDKYGDCDSLSSDEEPLVEVLKDKQIKSLQDDKCSKPKTFIKDNIEKSPEKNIQDPDILNRMPILNSILQELIKALKIKENIPCCCQNTPIKDGKETKDCKSAFDEVISNEKTLPNVNTAKKTIPKDKKERRHSPLKRRHSQKRKKVLKYGETRTQMLRSKINIKKQQPLADDHKIKKKVSAEVLNKPLVKAIKSLTESTSTNISDDKKPYYNVRGDVSPIESNNNNNQIPCIRSSTANKEKDNLSFGRKSHDKFRRSISITIPTPDIIEESDNENYVHGVILASGRKSEVGFYSPAEPIMFSKSELGEFDDNVTWSSANFENKDNGDSHTETSSISLPQMSEQSINSQNNEFNNKASSRLNYSKSTHRSNQSGRFSGRQSSSRYTNYSDNFEKSDNSQKSVMNKDETHRSSRTKSYDSQMSNYSSDSLG